MSNETNKERFKINHVYLRDILGMCIEDFVNDRTIEAYEDISDYKLVRTICDYSLGCDNCFIPDICEHYRKDFGHSIAESDVWKFSYWKSKESNNE